MIKGQSGPNELVRLYSKTSAKREVLSQVSSMSYGYKARRRKDRSRIADVKANSFFKDPRRREVISRAGKETVIAVNVLGGVVSKTEPRCKLLVTPPFRFDEAIAPEARPKEAPNTRTDC